MVYPPTLPPDTRTDSTVAAGNHASDHNELVAAIASLIEVLGTDPAGAFVDLTSRLTALPSSDELAGVFVQAISPLDAAYGAAGDDTADDTAPLQAAITAAAPFGVAVDLRGKTYKITDVLNVPAGTTLRNGFIHQTGAGKTALKVQGSRVTLRELTITGRHTVATAASGEYAIRVQGADSSHQLSGILIEGCAVELFGMYGISLEHVSGFKVINNDLGDIGYAAISTLSALHGVISGNYIDNVLAGFSSNGYGIALSRNEVNSLTSDPRSAKIVVADNVIKNIPWEGIDTHGGEDLTVTGNVIINCKTGIAIGSADGAGQVNMYAPLRVTVTGNTIDSTRTDGSYGAGISFTGVAGATSATPAVEYATGTIANNVIRGHGDQSNSNIGAIYMRNTLGVAVTGNVLIEPAPSGVLLYYDNRAVSVIGNTIVDVWSNTVTSSSAAITLRADYTTGLIAGNTMYANGKAATTLNAAGLWYPAAAVSDVNIGINSFGIATNAIVNLPTGQGTKFNTPVTTTLIGFRAPTGSSGSPSFSFSGDTDTGFYNVGDGQIGVVCNGTRMFRFTTSGLLAEDGALIALGTGTGTMLGTGATQKLGFWGKVPIARPTGTPAAATDLATAITLVNSLRTALINMGLVS